MTLADLLRRHWPEYVARAGPRRTQSSRGASQIPASHWRAVEAVLSCRTPRLGGHVHCCTDCGNEHYAYHSCNHRACPRCGGAEQQAWSDRQQARLLPVPYFMLTFTVPESMRGCFLRYDKVLYKALFAAASGAVKDLFADPKHFGGQPGFIAVLHTWTRQMAYHPHLHLILPAVALAPEGCEAIRAKYPEFLLPHHPLAERYRDRFLADLKDKHPGIAADLDPALATTTWNINVQPVGRGKSALRYLSAYVAKSAFSEKRLDGYDRQGRIRLWWTDSSDGRPRRMTLEPVEFIRRWLLHVLPGGFTRVRHYGFLSGAARAAYRRLRFLLGSSPVQFVQTEQIPISCPCCDGPMQRMYKIPPARGPPLSRALLPQ